MRDFSAARSPNLSILKEISPEHSLEGLMLKLKLQYFGHLIRSTDLFEKYPDHFLAFWLRSSVKKTLILGEIEGGRRRG